MPRLFKTLAERHRSARNLRQPATRRARPVLEGLEVRDLKAASLANGTLAIVGSAAANRVTVEYDTRLTPSRYDDRITVSEFNGGPFGQIHHFPIYTFLYSTPGGANVYRDNISKISFDGLDGDDTFVNETDIDSIAYGGAGNDWLIGGYGQDGLYGGGNNDVLSGQDGNDVLHGGPGNDFLLGDDGDDKLHGDMGDDDLYGGDGTDVLHGNANNDFLDGGSGNDTLFGDDGNDELKGAAGDDFLYGQVGIDTLRGGADNDHLEGGTSGDDLRGEGGDDYLQGDNGEDYLDGGDGDDDLDGGEHSDDLYGGLGEDLLDGGAAGDVLYGGFHDDRLLGGDGGDILHGQEGDDRLDGQGNDHLYGEAHDDLLLGGNGADTLDGGDGNDYLKGASSPNATGDGSADVLTGGTGSDAFVPEWYQAPNGAWVNRDQPTDYLPHQFDRITGTINTPLSLSLTAINTSYEDDEPYAVIWVGNLTDPSASFALRTDVDPSVLPTVLGSQPFGDPANRVILVAYLEHDESNPESVFSAVQAAMLPSLLSGQAQSLGRAALVDKLITDMGGALVQSVQVNGNDDDAFLPQELVITEADLDAARDGTPQLLGVSGGNGSYAGLQFTLKRD
jgi:Ca2+-binding RTX toxin-like protein